MSCTDCGGKLVTTNADEVCTLCGLEQGCPVFVSDYNFEQSEVLLESHEKHVRNSFYDIFEYVQTSLHQSDSIMEITKEMLYLYLKDSHIKGEKRKKELVGACVYYATKTLNIGKLSKDEINNRLFNKQNEEGNIQWACKDLFTHLANNTKFLHLFKTNDTQFTNTRDLLMKKLRKICEGFDLNGYLNTIFKMGNKIYDRIHEKDNGILLFTHPDKLNVSIFFVVSKILKLDIKLNTLSNAYNTSPPVILKYESKILSLI